MLSDAVAHSLLARSLMLTHLQVEWSAHTPDRLFTSLLLATLEDGSRLAIDIYGPEWYPVNMEQLLPGDLPAALNAHLKAAAAAAEAPAAPPAAPGPSMATLSSLTQAHRVDKLSKVNGSTGLAWGSTEIKLRAHCLRARGWLHLGIPHWEWQAVAGNEQLAMRYLRHKVQQAVPARLPGSA